MIAVFHVSPANRVDFDQLAAGWGGCVSMICWCGIGEKDDNKKKWEVLRTIWLASCQNRISSSHDVPYTQDESCCVWPKVAGVSHHPTMCNMLVRCCVFVNRDKLRCTTAEIA
jgi:hypothetical protein